jgi:hypothetical protein
MVATISIQPFQTTVAQGQFGVTTVGMVQGDVFPDPQTRNAARTTILADTETLPMWGGVGIYEDIPGVAGGPSPTLGPVVGRANSLTGSKALAGFSTWSYSNVNSPQSPVPLAGSGQQVIAFALGSRARIVVACDPDLVAELQGQPIGGQVSWDFVNQRLIPYVGTLTISSGTYNNTTGVTTLTMSAPITFGDGDAIVLSSLTGTGAYAGLNGTWTAIDPTGGSTVTFVGTAGLGASTITDGSLVLGSGASSLLPVKVLDVQEAGNMVVDYDAVTGFATWNFDGAAAVIQI